MEQIVRHRDHKFNDLMQNRVREVLLVSSLYDAFILQEDGHLSEQVFLEYKDLSLSSAPRFTHVTSGEAAIRELEKRRFDLVLAMPRLADMDLEALGWKVKYMPESLPVVVLTFDNSEVNHLRSIADTGAIDAVFMWNGDVKILLAIVKFIEDKKNLDNDIAVADIRAILVVEDSVRFYSSFFAALYPVLMKQSQSLFSEGLNILQKLMRMRTRPKIIHASKYEQALDLFNRYRENMLAVISDVGFERDGSYDPDAGIDLIRHVRAESPDLPILMQSADEEYAQKASSLGVRFVNKNSPSLLHALRDFLKNDLGFGDFVFRMPDGTEVARAGDIRELEHVLKTVPLESLEFHTTRNHVSNWLMARSEFELAAKLKPRQVSDFASMEDVRQHLVNELRMLRRDVQEGVISDFSRENFDPQALFQRIGDGSMGGKARGIAFLYRLLSGGPYRGDFGGMETRIPQTFVLTNSAFDEFMEINRLYDLAYNSDDDQEIARRFLESDLPPRVVKDLRVILDHLQSPLAVRSSSLLEDSMFRPFAGIYRTMMICNSHADYEIRLRDLCNAIKMVYASTFYLNAKSYIESSNYRIEEEKMAVVIQPLVAQRWGDRLYPHFAGTAQSYNYYPVGPLKARDGVVQVALGFGRQVVEGGRFLRFCPRHPAVLPQFSSPALVLKNSQSRFYALDMSCAEFDPATGLGGATVSYDISAAAEDGTLALVGSVYNAQDDRIVEGPDQKGPWVITFNNILKHKVVPLAPAMVDLLEVTREAMGCDVEIEFACDMGDWGRKTRRGEEPRPPILYPLQLRPLVTVDAMVDFQARTFSPDQIICRSTQMLGHGIYEGIRDVVYVKHDTFEPARTRDIATQVGRINEQLLREKTPYILIGPGRWGTADFWLGIPVQWSQINGASIIIEAPPEGYNVDPSQGTHFFQNITALRIGYLTVPPGAGRTDGKEDFIDWDWLDRQKAAQETEFLRHVRLDRPLIASLDGREEIGLIAVENND